LWVWALALCAAVLLKAVRQVLRNVYILGVTAPESMWWLTLLGRKQVRRQAAVFPRACCWHWRLFCRVISCFSLWFNQLNAGLTDSLTQNGSSSWLSRQWSGCTCPSLNLNFTLCWPVNIQVRLKGLHLHRTNGCGCSASSCSGYATKRQ